MVLETDEPSVRACRQRAWRRQRRASRRQLCACCGRLFIPGRSDAAFCCQACRQLAYRRRRVAGIDAPRRPYAAPWRAFGSPGPPEHRDQARGSPWARPARGERQGDRYRRADRVGRPALYRLPAPRWRGLDDRSDRVAGGGRDAARRGCRGDDVAHHRAQIGVGERVGYGGRAGDRRSISRPLA
jgi:hypothetical protein